ncbi:ANK [Mytilus edulis]|uniref:ANK n=1 Tax=Mytilus edulis TaxID=6550 RepID=A0A8S3VC08_MYTED|nr:ANK [Mytilus edulis]
MQVTLANTKDTVIQKENCLSGTTPLIASCHYGYTDMVQWMLHNEVVVDQCRDDDACGLLMASHEGHTDIRNPVPCDNTSLSTSYVNNNIRMRNSQSLVQPLMKHKPDINAQTNDGGNALYFSACNGHIEIVKLLLENNADSSICIFSKQYIAEMIKKHPTGTLGVLKQNIFDTLVKSTLSCVTSYVSKKSVEYAFDVVAGSSPLHIACFMGRIDVVSCLLDHNANINMTKDDGITP